MIKRCGLFMGLMGWMWLPSAEAQQPGDWMVLTQAAEIKVGAEVLEIAPAGLPVRVREVRGGWVGVANESSGWIHRRHLLRLDEAVARYTARIEANPDDERAYLIRGVLFNTRDECNKAVADFTRAIRLNARNRAAYANRAIAWKNKGEFELAIEDYTEAIQLDPNVALTWHNRGHAWALQGKFDRAVRDFREAIWLNPDAFDSYNALAWLQATCPDARYRDGEQAVKNARKACELCGYGRWYTLGTLAAAYAEAGEFSKAVAWERKCLQKASREKQSENALIGAPLASLDGIDVSMIRRVLELYQARRPYRDDAMPLPLAAVIANESSAAEGAGRPR